MNCSTVRGIDVCSNVPLSGNYPGHWNIDIYFSLPIENYIFQLDKQLDYNLIKKVYSGSVSALSVRASGWNKLTMSFNASSPEIIPLVEVVAGVVGAIIGLYFISKIVVTISSNPALSIAVPLIAGAAIIGAIAYLLKGVKHKNG